MFRRHTIMISIPVCCLLIAPVSAEIYKWIDENGNVVFSERKPTTDATEIETLTPKISSHAGAASGVVEKNTNRGDDGVEKTPDDVNKKPELKPLTPEQKAQNAEIAQNNCASAQRRLTSLQRPRVNQVLANGERRRMGEDERQVEIQMVKKAIGEWCD